MSEKRRDQRGRILKTGESHRKDGLYMFRYTDTRKQRRYIYARSLEELRRKEAEIQRDLADGIDYAAGEMTVLELVTRYMDLKRTLKENSYRAYDTVINRMRKDPFSQKQIRQIKPSDAKAWFVSLHDRGYKQSTISTVQCVVRPAFEMAVDDDMIRKNPFKFKLSDVIPKDAFRADGPHPGAAGPVSPLFPGVRRRELLRRHRDPAGHRAAGQRTVRPHQGGSGFYPSLPLCAAPAVPDSQPALFHHQPQNQERDPHHPHDGHGLHGPQAGAEGSDTAQGGNGGGRVQRLPVPG